MSAVEKGKVAFRQQDGATSTKSTKGQVTNVNHNGESKYLNSYIADVVLIRDEGNIIRHYQHLERLDTKVRHQRALVKRVSPGTSYQDGPNETKAAKHMKKLIQLEFQQQQGLLGFVDPGPNKLPVVKAFVTFNNIESFQRCVQDYDEMWRRHLCCPCCSSHQTLRLRYKHLVKVTPAPEPSDVLYENQGEYIHACAHRWRFWSSLLVVGVVLLCSLLLILSTYVIKADILPASSSGGTEQLCSADLPQSMTSTLLTSTPTVEYFNYARGTPEQDTQCQQKIKTLSAKYIVVTSDNSKNSEFLIANKYNMSKCTATFHSCTLDVLDQRMCPCALPDSTEKCAHIDSSQPGSSSTPPADLLTTKNGDLAVCYCIQKLNRLTVKYEGNSASALSSLMETDTDICSVWLESNAIGAGWSMAASLVIAVVNVILGHTIDKKSSTARPSSVSAKETQIFLIYFVAQLFNSVALTVFVNAEIVIWTFQSIGDHSDFSRAWFASAGSALTTTMLILSIYPHLAPMLKCCRFSHKRTANLKAPARTNVSQSELNAKCIGPTFALEYRLTEVLIPVTTALLFGTFLPLLYPIALFAVLLGFLVNKTLILKYHKRPPSTDASIPVFATDVLIITTLLRIALSCWIFGIESMFVSDGAQDELVAQHASGFFERIGKSTTLPHVFLLFFLVSVLIARRVWSFTLGSVLETLAYWLMPAHCCGQDALTRNATASTKPPFTSTFGTIIPPVENNKFMQHQPPSIVMRNRGWCHVCEQSTNCLDVHCPEWHYRRKRWLSKGVVQGLQHTHGQLLQTWEVIRETGNPSYRMVANEKYIHVVHLRNEERFGDENEELLKPLGE